MQALLVTCLQFSPGVPTRVAAVAGGRASAFATSEPSTILREVEECIVDAESPDELEACVKPDSPWSLEEKNDGWDDVRAGIIEAKRDRAKAWDALASDASVARIKKASKWAKVIADEVVMAASSGEGEGGARTAQDGGGFKLPSLPIPSAREASAQGGGLKGAALAALDKAGRKRQAELGVQRQERLLDAEPAEERKKSSGKDTVVAGATIALVLGSLLAAPILALLVGLGDI